MFIFKETQADKEAAKNLREYQWGNPFLRPFCRTIINDENGESVGVFRGFVMAKEKVAKAKMVDPEALVIAFDSVDQSTYEFYFHEIESRVDTRAVFVAFNSLVYMKLEYEDSLDEIVVAFREHIKTETGQEIGAMYAFNVYQSEVPDSNGYYAIDNDNYPGFTLVEPGEDGDPGLFCRRVFS